MTHPRVKIKKVNKIFNKALKTVNKSEITKDLNAQQKAEFAYSLARMALGRD